jgi:hypothetical protein
MKVAILTLMCVAVAVATSAVLTSVSYASNRGFEEALSTPFSSRTIPAPTGSLLKEEIAVLMNRGIGSARAWQDIHVQGEIAQTDLVSKVETTLGSTFAGVWFDPAAARFHVGVTSNASKRAAERVLAREAPAGNVTVTPVRSTIAQLIVTQKRWNHKLARLFRIEEVETGLDPQRNMVSVILGSAVPSRERIALKHEAAVSAVKVVVTVAARSKRRMTPEAKTECKTWTTSKAYCNPSITPGVTILTKKKPECTAGPVGINAKKERVLITAGHCIEKEGEEWSAINKAEKESVIGRAKKFVNGSEKEGGKLGDYAEISIEKAWQTGNAEHPVFAVTARWKVMNAKKEENSYPVVGEQTPQVGNTACLVGQNTGESCGQVKMLNVTNSALGRFREGLVSVEPAESTGGDSGGPWLFLTEKEEIFMQGSHVGKSGGIPVFEPLKQPVEKAAAGSLEGLSLKLLTKANE